MGTPLASLPEHAATSCKRGQNITENMTTPTVIRFVVHGIPKGQPRPRAFARRMGNKFTARVYDPGTAEAWKSAIAVAARQYAGLNLTGPVALEVVYRMPRPKSHFKRNGNLRPDAPHYHTGKPDIDNMNKALLDALTQIGVWGDDAQVVREQAEKLYVWYWPATTPGAAVTIRKL